MLLMRVGPGTFVVVKVPNGNVRDRNSEEPKDKVSIGFACPRKTGDLRKYEPQSNCQSAQCTSQTRASLDAHTVDRDQGYPKDEFDAVEDHDSLDTVPSLKLFEALRTDHVGVEYK